MKAWGRQIGAVCFVIRFEAGAYDTFKTIGDKNDQRLIGRKLRMVDVGKKWKVLSCKEKNISVVNV